MFDFAGVVRGPGGVGVADASTQRRVSRHYVFRDIIFPDIVSMKIFVDALCRDLPTRRESAQQPLHHSANEITIHDSSFIDKSVYANHRCFRLIWSTKAGEKRFLRPIDHRVFLNDHDISGCIDVFRGFLIQPGGIEPNMPLTPGVFVDQKLVCHMNRPHFGERRQGTLPSPFPFIDRVVNTLISSGGV